MVFSSHIFLFYFLPIALAMYALTPARWRHFVLTIQSYVFYGWTNPLFCILLLFSTAVDYTCGLVLTGGRQEALPMDGERTRRQKAALVVSITTNLALLGFFKYFNFGADSLSAILHMFQPDAWTLDAALRVTLPLGISFYTFQSMSYAIDVYRGHAVPIRNFTDFACFVSLFPQLVAGPIIRYAELADQLRHRTHTWEKFARGWALFLIGLAKKILLANPCGKIADTAFGASSLHTLDAWTGAVAYAFQIYFDFSGYSDMAIGLGLMFGFTFAKNFDSPYHSASITEFWRRWHISLSSWLRDYLYVPLGGNRLGPWKTYRNLFLVMLLGGLWHGAAWNFVVWGGLHGLLLAAERAFGKRSLFAAFPRPLQIAGTFVVVLFTWVFFRAEDLGHALRYIGAMFSVVPALPAADLVGVVARHPVYVAMLLVSALVVWCTPQAVDWTRRLTTLRFLLILAAGALAVLVMTTEDFNPFIYFIF